MNAGPSRLGFRLAARQARRRRGRTLLVLALVAIPVAGMTMAASAVRSARITEAQARTWNLGRADAAYQSIDIYGPLGPAPTEALVSSVPRGGRVVVTRSAVQVLRHNSAAVQARTIAMPLDDPLLAGTFVLRSGRGARTGSEIAVSPSAARALGAHVGEEVDLAGVSLRVVGVVADPADLRSVAAFVSAPELLGPSAATKVFVAGAQPQRIPPLFIPVSTSRAQDDVGRVAAIYVIGGVVLLVGAIVAAAAFAVSTRRHLRELGILGAAGATPGQLAWIQAFEGVVLGGAGAVVGLALGTAGALTLSPELDDLVGHATRGFELSLPDVLVATGLGVSACAIAAWMPARSAFNLPTLSALAGRRPAGELPGAVPVLGAGMVGLGILLLAWVANLEFGGELWSFSLGGVVAVALGTLMLTVWLVTGFEAASRWARGLPRLALRSLARHRARSAAVVGAAMAIGALAVGGSGALLADDAKRAAEYVPSAGDDQVLVGWSLGRGLAQFSNLHFALDVPGDVESAIAAELPTAVRASRLGVTDLAGRTQVIGVFYVILPQGTLSARVSGRAARSDFVGSSGLSVATPELLRALAAPEATVTQLAASPIVVFGPRDLVRPARLLTSPSPGKGEVREIRVSVVATPRQELWGHGVVAPEHLENLGLRPIPAGVVFRSPAPLTSAQRSAVDRLARTDLGRGFAITQHKPFQTNATRRLLLSGAALALALIVVALGVALMAAESRDEEAVLAALGAAPRDTARVRAAQSGALALLGGVLAVPLGFMPLAAYAYRSDDWLIRFPTTATLTVTLVIPVVVAFGALVATRLAAERGWTASLLAADD